LALLGNGVVLCATLAAFFGMGTMVGLSVYVPIYFQSVLGLSAASSGLGLIPLFGCGVIGATISGRAIVVVTHYKRIPLVGLACGAAALSILALAPAMPLLAVVTLLAVAGLATGSMFPVTTVSLQNAVHPHQLGTATATMNFFRQLGGAILVAGFGAILLGAAGISRGRAAEAVIGAPGVADPHVAAAFGWIFAGAAAGLAAGWLFLLIMEERPLRDRPPGEGE
jgi:predicted MFS family arabinose efflux permease